MMKCKVLKLFFIMLTLFACSTLFLSCQKIVEYQNAYRFIDIKVSTAISDGYAKGDVLFKDNTLMSATDFSSEVTNGTFTKDQLDTNPVVGILAYEFNGSPYFVGVKRSAKSTIWAKKEAEGYASIPALAGDIGENLFGINSLKSVKQAVTDFSDEMYPALGFASTYEPYFGSGEQGRWFLPSIYEGLVIAGAAEEIDSVLKTLCALDSSNYELFFNGTDPSTKVNYWSSTTKEYEDKATGEITSNVWVYRNENGAIRDFAKDKTAIEGNLGAMSCLVVKRGDYKNYHRPVAP